MGKRDSQLELGIPRHRVPDRNAEHGGRSFYFFDFDDNVMHLETPIFLFKKGSKEEMAVSTGDFANRGGDVGKRGPYADYEVDLDDAKGSFRSFRDDPTLSPDHRQQHFVRDIRKALAHPDFRWKGPSWQLFHHAVFNHRPISVITARGHGELTLAAGVEEIHHAGYLPHAPEFLGLWAVSHPRTRIDLGDTDTTKSIAQLKRSAILQSVARSMDLYGENPHHRFGMSDDSPENLDLITDAMLELKKRYPENAFFVIDSSNGQVIKNEVVDGGVRAGAPMPPEQMSLW